MQNVLYFMGTLSRATMGVGFDVLMAVQNGCGRLEM
jgi:hypothetical protein